MTRWRWLVLLFAPVLLGQRRLPDIGELMYQSRDYEINTCIREGGILVYDDATHLFSCTSAGALSGTLLRVTLTAGTRTVVSDARITSGSAVSCGCQVPTDGTGPSCNLGASWLARVRVTDVTDGSAVLIHAYALGDEEMVCMVTTLMPTPTPTP